MANSLFGWFRKIREYLDERDLAGQDQEKVPLLRRAAHFWLLAGQSFVRNRGPVRASALAYTTLLALIPILAVVVSLSTTFLKKDGEKPIGNLIEKLVATAAPQLGLAETGDAEEAAINRQAVVQKIMGFIENINSGKLGASATVALIFIGISLLSTIETAFNDIWGVIHGRSWSARIVQYWAAISLGPLFLVTALVLTTSTQFAATRGFLEEAPVIGGLIFKALPFVVLSLMLTLFYKLMPNTKVLWSAAFAGGVLGGVLLQLNSIFNVIYLSKVVSYSKIYGGLGVLPIFLVGLYFSWLILLFGAQVSYAFQNRLAYLQERHAETVNQRGREFIALRLMTFITQRFEAGEKPPSRLEMAKELGVPSQLAASLLMSLAAAKLVTETQGEETGYAPGRPVERISVEDVLNALRAGQGRELATSDDPARAVVREQYERILSAEAQTAGAVSFRTLAARAGAAAPQLTAGREGVDAINPKLPPT